MGAAVVSAAVVNAAVVSAAVVGAVVVVVVVGAAVKHITYEVFMNEIIQCEIRLRLDTGL